VTFNVTPGNARVYRVEETNLHSLGQQGRQVNIEFPGVYYHSDPAQQKPMIFLFSVPQWFGKEYPDWSNIKDVPKGEEGPFTMIRTYSQLVTGVEEKTLNLPFFVAVQAWTLAHPVLSLLGLLFPAAGLWAVFKRKQLKAYLDSWRTPEARSAPPLVPGYRLGASLGEGAMGEVVAATSESQLPCAIKFIRRELLDDDDQIRRFKREIEAVLPLSHPNLLRLYGHGVATDGRLYTIWELLEGRTLKEVIRAGDYDPPQLASQVVEQIGDALEYLHQRELIHRDVKPDNIFVCQDGTMKLMDTGLVSGDMFSQVTRTGQIVGTPAYMAPEQSDDKAVCPASDQYALGILLYEILAGARPFLQTELAYLVYQHKFAPPAPPSELQPAITPTVEQAVLRMLAKQPQQRFPSLEEAQEALESLRFASWRQA
jgi:hypothetical protein